jgi:uncharacterized protein (DUF1501 family)
VLNRLKLADYHDPETQARIDQYEMAFRMQSAVPDLADLSKEPADIYERYGPESKKPGTYAANCILARRLAERGVRFIQLYHRGWDQHNNLPSGIKSQCHDTDQPTAALLAELKERGMLDDTLVIAMGEFGRTPNLGTQGSTDGRNHWPVVMSMSLAGGGFRHGQVIGASTKDGAEIEERPVTPGDLAATIYQHMGVPLDATYMDHQGRPNFIVDQGAPLRELV